jgi:Flp pilus assembly protein TadG
MAPITSLQSSSGERGAALVEFALVAPLLLVVLAGIVDFGFLFQRYEVLTNAAREGARLGSLPGYVTCGTPSTAVDQRVRDYVQQGLALTAPQVTAAMPSNAVVVTCPTVAITLPGGSTANVTTVRVQVTYTHNFIMLGPIIGLINGNWGNAMNIVTQSQMRLEAGAAGAGS